MVASLRGEPASETSSSNAVNTTDIYHNDNPSKVPDYLLAETLNDKEWPGRYRVNEYNYVGKTTNRTHNFVIIDSNKIELDFDTDCITIEYDTIKTERSKVYGCEFPVIPDNAILVEAIGFIACIKCYAVDINTLCLILVLLNMVLILIIHGYNLKKKLNVLLLIADKILMVLINNGVTHSLISPLIQKGNK